MVSVSKLMMSALLIFANHSSSCSGVVMVVKLRSVLTDSAKISLALAFLALVASETGLFAIPVGTTPSASIFSKSRFQLFNSKRSNNSCSLALSNGRGARSAKLSCRPISTRMVMSSFAFGNHSSAARKFSPTLPLMLSAFSIMPSNVPYSVNHLTAVLGPTFSTPGTLSTLSPISVK